MPENILISGSAGFVEIPVYKNRKIICHCVISADDFDEISKYRWLINTHGYACRIEYIDEKRKKFKRISMHRQILRFPENKEVDHINLNRLDNRRENLRIVTCRENMFNKNMYTNNKVGYKGVYLKHGKYCAEIGYEDDGIFIGYYSNVKEAALAYNIKAIELFGEYANLNILDDKFVADNIDKVKKVISEIGRPKGVVKYWGVWLKKRTGKYVVETSKDGVKYYGGEYNDPKLAALAYNKLAAKIHGEKAKFNIVE